MADRVGQHIDDYRLIRLLGTGSFGEVYMGEHLYNQTLAAVKMLSLSQENLKEFVKEASTAFRLKHPHIIGLLAFGMSADESPYLIMDYAPNGTLRQRHPKGTRLPLKTIVSHLIPLTEALQYAHDRRVIHRDVKPENVLIGQDEQILLSDFGLALMAPIEQSLSTQNLSGTAPYMAPEQIRGKPQAASDQYALGIMAYEWLCGVRPFQGTLWEIIDQHRSDQPPPLREKLPDLPLMVEEIILKALAKDPQDRFACVLDFATALQQAIHTGKSSPALSSSSLSLAPLPTDVSPRPEQPAILQPEQTPEQPATAQPRQTPNMPAAAQPKQVPSKLPSREPVAITNPALSTPTAVPPTVSVTPSFPSPPISSPRTPQPVFFSARLPPIRRGPATRKLILFVGLLLLIVGSSVFFSLSVINNLVKNSPSATTSTIAPPLITATAATRAYATGTAKIGVMFGFDAAHTHWNPYEKVLNKTNISHLKLDWSYPTGDIIYSSPAVANGLVYVDSGDDKFYAFDAGCRSACQPLWSYPMNGRIDSSPAVANGVVYVGSNDGKLYAFDASCRSACQPWSYPTGGSIGSSPAVANGIIYVGSGDHKLYAFDAGCRSACQPLWSYPTGSWIYSSPAVANGIVYVGSEDHKLEDHKLYAFDASCRSSCKPLWSYPTGDAIDSSPAVANSIVYVGSDDDKLYAFDASCRSACQPLWSYTTGGSIYFSSPAVANGLVYVGSDDHKLYAFGL